MKRKWIRMLALMLGLSMLASCAMAEEVILAKDESRFFGVWSLVSVGDELYVLATTAGSRASILRWKEDMPTAEILAEDLFAASYFNSTESVALFAKDNGIQNDPRYALSCIFTDGEKLYGYNALEQLIFRIDVTEEGVKFTDETILKMQAGQDANLAQAVFQTGKWLIWQERDASSRNRNQRMLLFNLETGAVKQAVLNELQAVLPYEEGKVIVITEPDASMQMESKYAVSAYDPETDLCDVLGYLPDTVTGGKAAWHSGLGMIVYVEKTRVMGWSPETGDTQLGFLPEGGATKMEVLGDTLAYVTGNGLTKTALRKDYTAEHQVNIIGRSQSGAEVAFHQKYPGVPYYYLAGIGLQPEKNWEELLTREEDAPDIISLNAAADGNYFRLAENGYLHDLSAYPELKAYVDALYPAFREAVTDGDAIYGIPVYADGYDGWFINKAVMKELGLTAEDIPTSLTEMCAFATRWNEEFAEKYPQYTLLNNTVDYRDRLLQAILERYSDYCQFTGKELDAHDPALQEALAALDVAKLDKLDAGLRQTDPEKSEYKQALIWTGLKVVRNWGRYMEDFSDRIFIPLTLTEDTPYTAKVDKLTILAVNAKSKDADYAAAMLAEEILCVNARNNAVLRTDCTEPVIWEDYSDALTLAETTLKELEERQAESVSPEAAEKRIADEKAWIERLKREMYEIPTPTIDNYVNTIVPGMFIDRMSGEQFTEALYYGTTDYAEGKITLAEFTELMHKDFTTEPEPGTPMIPVGGFG